MAERSRGLMCIMRFWAKKVTRKTKNRKAKARTGETIESAVLVLR